MAPSLPPVRQRRRPRRGSLERPVDGRLYRTASLVVVLPLVLAAFTFRQPVALQAPPLPPTFDAKSTARLAASLANDYPDRTPGSSGALGAASWLRSELEPYGLTMRTDTWSADVPGIGQARLQNVWVVAEGASRDVIVVMAHRDDIGVGPG